MRGSVGYNSGMITLTLSKFVTKGVMVIEDFVAKDETRGCGDVIGARPSTFARLVLNMMRQLRTQIRAQDNTIHLFINSSSNTEQVESLEVIIIEVPKEIPTLRDDEFVIV